MLEYRVSARCIDAHASEDSAKCARVTLDTDVNGVRQDKPPKMVAITYERIVDTDGSDRRLEHLHDNVRKFGTISNTLAEATKREGVIRRKM